jgi:ankyrin repeat protein
MKNLRLLSLAGLFVICCTENVSSTSQAVQQPNEFVQQPGEPDQQSDALFVQQITNAALAENNTQIQQLLDANPNYSIDQQNPQGQTPLHILLSSLAGQDVQIVHVTLLLQRGADGLMAANNRTTPLDMAAATGGVQQAGQLILRVVVKKIILDRLVHAIANNQVRPFNPTENYRDIAATSTETPTDANLTLKLCTVFERYNIPTNILQAIIDALQVGDAPNQPTIQYHMDLLQAYIHVNNLSIDSKTLGNFNIHFRALNGKNLLQLAGDRRNTRLVHCICSRIYTPFYTPWALYYLSRASDTNWISPMYDNLRCNDEIRQTIRTRYWSQFLDYDVLRLVITGTIVACLGGLILQRLYPN